MQTWNARERKHRYRQVCRLWSRCAVGPATSEDNLKNARSVHAILTNRARTESTTMMATTKRAVTEAADVHIRRIRDIGFT